MTYCRSANSPGRVWLAACVFALLVHCAALAEDREIIGLYIGMGHYQDARPTYESNATHKDRLLPSLTRCFGISWGEPLMDGSREVVRDRLRDFLERIRQARSEGREVTAVLYYFGHGSRVEDQNGDESDHLDETWVTVTKSEGHGEHDIRDDDVAMWRAAVADLGADLVMFVDACHCATSWRGSDGLSVSRGEHFPPGPREPLFPELCKRFGNLRPDAKAGEFVDACGPPKDTRTRRPRFVCFAATQDNDVAEETDAPTGPDGCQEMWGRFSYALQQSLLKHRPGHSYADLHRDIGDYMQQRGWKQQPALHAVEPADRRTVCFATQLQPVHFHVTARQDTAEDGEYEVDAGLALGLVSGTQLRVLASLDALYNNEPPVAEALVEKAILDRAIIRLVDPSPSPVPEGAVAVVSAWAASDLPAFVSANVPEAVRDELLAHGKEGRLALCDDPTDADFIIDKAKSDATLAIYAHDDAVFRKGAPDSAEPGAPLRTIEISSNGQVDTIADQVAVSLDELTRQQRFWGLTGNEANLEIQAGIAVSSDTNEIIPFMEVGGVAQVPDGARIRINITSRGTEPYYVYLYYRVEALGQGPLLMRIGDTHRITLGTGKNDRTHSWTTTARLGDLRVDRLPVGIKVLVASKELDFDWLIASARARGARGPRDPFIQKLDRAWSRQTARGADATRARGDFENAVNWAARNVSFDIVPAAEPRAEE
ncbi:MAG: caspase family protein [Phycisphaerae bacterium]|jgi:hypothetical protein